MSLNFEKDERDLLITTRKDERNKTWLRIPVGAIADGVKAGAQLASRGIRQLKAKLDEGKTDARS